MPSPFYQGMLPGPVAPLEIHVTIAFPTGEGRHNRLSDRVPNPTNERIDGVVLAETARPSD